MAYVFAQTSSNGNGNHIQATVDYSESSTNDTHTLTLTSVKTVMSGNTANYPYADVTVTVTYGSTQLYKGTLRTSISVDGSASLSTASNTSKTHSAQTKTLKVSVSAATHWYDSSSKSATLSGSASANVSIAARPSYTVSFNANSGSGAPSSQTKWYGENLTLSSTKPTRTSYVFKRWNTNTSDTGTAYDPGASYTGNAALTLYAIWNPVIAYDANGGTGAPAAQTKTFGAALTLQSGTPTRTGYSFNGWNTAKNGSGTSYAAGATMAAGSNTAVTLYAQWKKLPEAPTVSSLTAVRSDSSGNASDDGTYCKVTAQWSIDTTNVSGNTATAIGVIQRDDGVAGSFLFSSGGSGTSGTATALISGLDTDHQYLVGIIVTDTRTSTTRATIMTRASFILDLKAGGKAMGIGSAAPSDGLEVGWATQFDKPVTMLLGLSVTGDLSVSGTITNDALSVKQATSDIFTAASGWTVVSQEAKKYGKVCSVYVVVRPTSAVAAKTSASTTSLGTFQSGYRPAVTQGFANQYGHGYVTSGGSASLANVFEIGTTASVYVALTFLLS